jgi:hypothetical protein
MMVTTPQMTKALGISKVRLCELARKGKIPKAGKNQWDVEAVQKAVGRNLSGFQTSPARGETPPKSIGNHKPATERSGAQRPAALRSDPQQAAVPLPVFQTRREEAPARGTLAAAELTIAQSKAVKEQAAALKIQGKLVDSDIVDRALAEIATRTQNAVLAIPAKIVNRLPPEWRHDVLAAAQDETRKILAQLANDLRSLSRAA